MKLIFSTLLILFSNIVFSQDVKEIEEKKVESAPIEKKEQVQVPIVKLDRRIRDGFIIEPFSGLQLGQFEQGYDANGTRNGITITKNNTYAEGDVIGFTFGGRFAYKKSGFLIGAETQLNYSTFDQFIYGGTSVSTESYDVNEVLLGVSGGYEFPFGLRFLAGFYPAASLSIDGGGKSNEYFGSGYKYGLGWIFRNALAFNLEYSQRTYNDRDNTKLPVTYVDSGMTITERELVVRDILFSMSFAFGWPSKN
jgi:hypothetical protein